MRLKFISASMAASFLVAGTLSAPVLAEVYDGSAPLICASIDTVQCDANGECISGTAAHVNLPQFFRVNFQEEIVRARRADGSERSTRIERLRHDGGHVILQGAEEGLGWSVLIDEVSGQMTITASGDGEAFVVFGACTVD
jgi:hypothetical protein